MKTYVSKGEIEKKWFVVDAEGQTLGRLASAIATILRGKHKVTFTPHMNDGDYVVVINADKIHLTGKKAQQKIYYHHTWYTGGLKAESFASLIDRKPEKVLMQAVKGMLPKNRLARQMIKQLKLYAGAEHPHAANKPEVLKV
ncbi:50S ribosomal protein L13 [Chrysiogenes arsenatis]|uniref:50S ribosomal protein L13 n=1 Tax=Chrysiogenes arsenatis TaxID=309797 RepID=UPI0004279E9D|nr:50S ribosomal protein L13 [Chrysiogenes arsenatis]